MKKLLITLAVTALSVSMLCSCSSNAGNSPNGTTTPPASGATESITTTAGRSETDKYLVKEDSEIEQLKMPQVGEEIAVITTNFGVIKVRFFPQYAPKAVENFITHAKEGYYDGLIYHRVISGFMIQSGDPLGTGMGGESIWGEPFAREIVPQLHHIRGALSMAKTSADISQGSQFFIVDGSAPTSDQEKELDYYSENQDEDVEGTDGLKIKDYFPNEIINIYKNMGGAMHLDYQYTVFGQTFEGNDVVAEIANVERDSSDKPLKDVVIETVKIVTYGGQ